MKHLLHCNHPVGFRLKEGDMGKSADQYFAIIPETVLYANISHAAVRVYGVLRRHADKDNGTCHPGRSRIAELANMGTRSVDRAINELEHIGAIEVTHRKNPDNPNQSLSNTYRLLTPRAPDHTPRADDHTPLALVTPPPRAGGAVTIAIEPESKNQTTPFDEWWQIYPKKVNKQAAIKAWKKAIKTVDPQHIIEATRQQTQTPDTPLSADPQYIPYPATWLNAGSYDNEYQQPAPQPIRPYDRPAHLCDRCDNTGYISKQDNKHRWTAHPCPQCNATI